MNTKIKYYNLIIFLTCLIAGICYVFANQNLGNLSGDELYQAICVRRYTECPLAILTYWIGHLWCDLFGFSLLNLRILTSVEMVLSVAITSWYLFHRTKNLRLTGVVFLLGCLILRSETFYYYVWDTGTYIFNALAAVLLLKSVSRPKSSTIFVLGIVTGLMTLGRAPSVIILPLAAIILYFSLKNIHHDQKQSYKKIISLAIGWLTCVIVLTWIILGYPFEYFELFRSENIISGHNPLKDIHYLHRRFGQMVLETGQVWFIGFFSMALALLTSRMIRTSYRVLIISVWILFCALYSYYYTSSSIIPMFMGGFGFPVGFVLLVSLPIYKTFRRNIVISGSIYLELCVIWIVLLASVFGTDSLLSRLTVGYLIPVIVAVLWKFKKRGFRHYLRCSVIVSLLTFIAVMTPHIIRSYVIGRNIPTSEIYPYSGLKFRSEYYDEISAAYDAIATVRRRGIPYVYAGESKLGELSFGPDEGIHFQDFHTFLSRYQDWIDNKNSFINKIDAVVYTPVYKEYDFNYILEDLKKEGFEKEEIVGNAVILYRSKRVNPDKNYKFIN